MLGHFDQKLDHKFGQKWLWFGRTFGGNDRTVRVWPNHVFGRSVVHYALATYLHHHDHKIGPFVTYDEIQICFDCSHILQGYLEHKYQNLFEEIPVQAKVY